MRREKPHWSPSIRFGSNEMETPRAKAPHVTPTCGAPTPHWCPSIRFGSNEMGTPRSKAPHVTPTCGAPTGAQMELPGARESANIARVAPVYGHRRSAFARIYWRVPYRTDGDRRRNCARTLVGLSPSHDAARGARDVAAGSPPAHWSRRAVPLLERKVRGPACRAVVRPGDAERGVRGRVSCRWYQPALLEGDIRGFLDVFRRVALAQDGQRARDCRSNHGERCLIAGCNFSECLPSAQASESWPGCWGSAGAPCWCRCWSCCSTSNSTGPRGRAWWRSCRPPALSLFWCTTKPDR